MKTPFTTSQFFQVFENYNSSLFPVPILIMLLGLGTLVLLHSKKTKKDKLIGSFLGLLWIWNGLVYHLLFFTDINPAACLFGGIFILQGLLLLVQTFKDRLNFTFHSLAKNAIGYFLIVFALFVYPLIGYLVEGSMVRTITLGLPCPSTILTFGFFLMTDAKFPKYLLIIPTIWSIIGISAVANFGVYQDLMLPIAALLANFILIRRKRIVG